MGALLAVAAAPHCRWCVQRPGDLSHHGAVEQVQHSCSLRQLCIEMANLPRSSRFRSASSLSCTRCWPWQGTVLKVISALGLELHVTAARCQLRRRAQRWLSNQPPTRVDRSPYTLCYAIPVRRRAGVGWSRHGCPCSDRPTWPGSPGPQHEIHFSHGDGPQQHLVAEHRAPVSIGQGTHLQTLQLGAGGVGELNDAVNQARLFKLKGSCLQGITRGQGAQALTALQGQPTDGSTQWPWGESVIAELIDELEIDGSALGGSRQNGLPAVQRHRLSTLAAASINHDFDLLGRHVGAAPEGQGHLMLLH